MLRFLRSCLLLVLLGAAACRKAADDPQAGAASAWTLGDGTRAATDSVLGVTTPHTYLDAFTLTDPDSLDLLVYLPPQPSLGSYAVVDADRFTTRKTYRDAAPVDGTLHLRLLWKGQLYRHYGPVEPAGTLYDSAGRRYLSVPSCTLSRRDDRSQRLTLRFRAPVDTATGRYAAGTEGVWINGVAVPDVHVGRAVPERAYSWTYPGPAGATMTLLLPAPPAAGGTYAAALQYGTKAGFYTSAGSPVTARVATGDRGLTASVAAVWLHNSANAADSVQVQQARFLVP